MTALIKYRNAKRLGFFRNTPVTSPRAAGSIASMDVPVALQPELSPVSVRHPLRQTVPLIVASPHSGRDYPADFLSAARLDPLSLRRSEDSFVDELFAAAPGLGAPLLTASFPRAFCDPNREKWELDPAMFEEPLPPWVNTTSARVGAGLGTIPRVVASGEPIYAGKLRFKEAQRRVEAYWEPYHDALTALLGGTRALFGAALLLDCHSMPAQAGPGQARLRGTDIVLGDAHGTACAPRITRCIEQILTELGYSVRRNDPYAGGYVTRNYGRPREGVHVVQLELARSLYMNEALIEPLPVFEAVQRDLTTLLERLAASIPGLMS